MWEDKEDEENDFRQMRGRRDLYQSELEIERGAQGIIRRRSWCKRTAYAVPDSINTVLVSPKRVSAVSRPNTRAAHLQHTASV